MKKYNGTTWVDTTLRQYKTATADIEPTIYTDGTAITSYTIKGNTIQNGTPTPTNPIAVNGVGELVGSDYQIPISSGGVTTNVYLGSTQTVRQIIKYICTGQEQWGYDATYTRFYRSFTDLMGFGLRLTPMYCTHYECVSDGRSMANIPNHAIYTGSGNNAQSIFFKEEDITSEEAWKTWLQQQYNNGTPVTLYYILDTATTAAVNEPLMKIGDYADTLSNAVSIPTTEGANSITVDTTVQPTEFTATWTGWHDSSVKEWDGSDWQ